MVGALAQDQVIAALRAADLFVLPCREGEKGDRDGLPNVILEAASQELAILSTTYAAVPEFIENGHQGVLVPPEDPSALSGALAALISDPARRFVLGKEARQKFAGAFSFEAGIAAIAARLEASVEGAQAGRASPPLSLRRSSKRRDDAPRIAHGSRACLFAAAFGRGDRTTGLSFTRLFRRAH